MKKRNWKNSLTALKLITITKNAKEQEAVEIVQTSVKHKVMLTQLIANIKKRSKMAEELEKPLHLKVLLKMKILAEQPLCLDKEQKLWKMLLKNKLEE